MQELELRTSTGGSQTAVALSRQVRRALEHRDVLAALSPLRRRAEFLGVLLQALPECLQLDATTTVQFCAQEYPLIRPWNVKCAAASATPASSTASQLYLDYVAQLMHSHEQCRENQRFVHRWFLQNLLDRPPARELLTQTSTTTTVDSTIAYGTTHTHRNKTDEPNQLTEQQPEQRQRQRQRPDLCPRAGSHLVRWHRDRELMFVVNSLCARSTGSTTFSSATNDPSSSSRGGHTPRALLGRHHHASTGDSSGMRGEAVHVAADLSVVTALCEEHSYFGGLLPLYRHAAEQSRSSVDQLETHRYLTLLLRLDDAAAFTEWILSGTLLRLLSWQRLLEVAQAVLSSEDVDDDRVKQSATHPMEDQSSPPTNRSARSISRELIASLLVRSLSGDQVLQLFGEYPFFVGRLPFEVYQQILRRTGSKAERDQLIGELLECVSEYLWIKHPSSLAPQYRQLREQEAGGPSMLETLPFVRSRSATNSKDRRFVLAFDNTTPLPRTLEDVAGQWGVHSRVRHGFCPGCTLPLEENVGLNVIVFPCSHAHHQACCPEEACLVCFHSHFRTLQTAAAAAAE